MGSGGRPRAVVIGAGIGGLAATAGLCAAGWDVTAFERAASLEPVGAGIGMAPNGLRALDALGVGDAVRAVAVGQNLGLRRPDGRWLLRVDTGRMLADRFGDRIILLPRARLVDILTGLVPPDVLSLSTEVTSVSAAGRVETPAGTISADLVVAADGIWSAARAALLSGHPAPAYCGFTAWRFITPVLETVTSEMSETWGRGRLFGVMPMAGGDVYCYATASVPPGQTAPGGDELALLKDLFADWHEPIGSLLEAVSPENVLRNDVSELPRPLPSFHAGRVAFLGDAAHPMTPNLGQGACQALEDAVTLARLAAGAGPEAVPDVLARYSAARLPRTTMVVRRSRRSAAMTTWTSTLAVAFRDWTAALVGRAAPGAALRGLAPVIDWHPPEAEETDA